MAAPIELRLSTKKPRTLAGEGIMVDLDVRVLASLDMESPELNRNRTAICVQSLEDGGETRILTGADYMRLHSAHPLSQIGMFAHVDAGAQWTVAIELLNFCAPLPSGRYAMALSYRYGETPEEAAETNAIEVEVTPAELLSAEYRWYGGSSARELLCCIWVARDAEGEHWMYQGASRRNPAAIAFAVDLGFPARRAGARPMLAHLNDIESMHFQRLVVWEQDGEIGILRVHRGGRAGEPAFVRHGLGGEVRLVDPPLQQRDDSLTLLVTGTANGRGAVALLVAPQNGAANISVAALPMIPATAVAIWPEASAALMFLKDARGRVISMPWNGQWAPLTQELVEALALTQWMGSGHLAGCYHDSESVRIFSQEASVRASGPTVNVAHEIRQLPAQPVRLADITLREAGNAALLYDTSDGWLVLNGDKVFPIPRHSGGLPSLIACAGGLFLVWHDPDRGFSAELIGPPIPGPRI